MGACSRVSTCWARLEGITYSYSPLSTQLLLQPVRKCPRYSRPIRIREVNRSAKCSYRRNKAAHQDKAKAWLVMCVLFGRKNAHDIVVFVHWLAIIASFLLVPPVGVGITELALDWRRIDVAAIL